MYGPMHPTGCCTCSIGRPTVMVLDTYGGGSLSLRTVLMYCCRLSTSSYDAVLCSLYNICTGLTLAALG